MRIKDKRTCLKFAIKLFIRSKFFLLIYWKYGNIKDKNKMKYMNIIDISSIIAWCVINDIYMI